MKTECYQLTNKDDVDVVVGLKIRTVDDIEHFETALDAARRRLVDNGGKDVLVQVQMKAVEIEL